MGAGAGSATQQQLPSSSSSSGSISASGNSSVALAAQAGVAVAVPGMAEAVRSRHRPWWAAARKLAAGAGRLLLLVGAVALPLMQAHRGGTGLHGNRSPSAPDVAATTVRNTGNTSNTTTSNSSPSQGQRLQPVNAQLSPEESAELCSKLEQQLRGAVVLPPTASLQKLYKAAHPRERDGKLRYQVRVGGN